jgi:hypothetical protein
MNPIKRKLAKFLTGLAKEGLDTLEEENPCARSLKGLDRDLLLEKNIQLICNELSTLEAGRALSLGAKLMLSGAGDVDKYKKNKEKIKSLALKVLKRVEKKDEGLNLPPECQDLIVNLL